MPLETPLVVRQQEKPYHYNYLKSFRVDQCKEFQHHQCPNHRPYTCFKWHFPNQRRRKPVLNTKDGRFNYSADQYCPNYDDSTGTCPDGDSCPLLHRNLGDSERRYHLRHYKTEMCSGDLDAHGNCSKNGMHCAFAHGLEDKRSPVLDITEQKAKNASGSSQGAAEMGPGGDDKISAVVFDPAWLDEPYLLTHYRTEPCQISAKHNLAQCPYYHNTMEKRRSIDIFKYRPSACPMVKDKDDWLEPTSCDKGDDCTYSHTRHELQYHPDIFRSQTCYREQKTGMCNKGMFCPFAHLSSQASTKNNNTSDASSNLDNKNNNNNENNADTNNNNNNNNNNNINNSNHSIDHINNNNNSINNVSNHDDQNLDYLANESSDESYLSTEPFPSSSKSVPNVSRDFKDDVTTDASTSTTFLPDASSNQQHLLTTTNSAASRLQSSSANATVSQSRLTSSSDTIQSEKSSLNERIRLDALDQDFSLKNETPPPGFNHKHSSETVELMKLKVELKGLQKTIGDLLIERDEAIKLKNQAIAELNTIKNAPAIDESRFLRCLHDGLDINQVNMATLFQIQAKLRKDLNLVKKAVDKLFNTPSTTMASSLSSSSPITTSSSSPSLQPRAKCLVCDLNPCTVTLACGHVVLCSECYISESHCPQCSSLILDLAF